MNPYITQRYKAIEEDLKAHFGSLYTMHDFNCAFMKFEDHDSNPEDRRTTLLNLFEMMESIGLVPEQDFKLPDNLDEVISVKPYREVIEKICREDPDLLSSAGLNNRIITYLCKRMDNFADPERYMERLVNALTFDEDRDAWAHHPLRTRILLQCIKYGNYLKAADYQGERMIRNRLKERLSLKALPDRDTVIAHLNDGDVAAILDEMQQATDQMNAYRSAFAQAQQALNDYFMTFAARYKLEDPTPASILRSIELLCSKDHDRENAQEADHVWQSALDAYLSPDLQERCAAPLSKAREDFVQVLHQFPRQYIKDRIEILMSFLRDEDKLPDSAYTRAFDAFTAHTGIRLHRRLVMLPDDPFDVRSRESAQAMSAVLEKPLNHYRDSTAKNRLKDVRRRYKLITMADDLATGKFRAQGGTRTDLYIFALMFDMVYTPPQAKGKKATTIKDLADIDKSLFQDYYQNNILRTISDTYQQKASAYESEPSGQRINFKFYEDVVFVYHIARKYDHLPQAERPLAKLTDVTAMLKALDKQRGAQDATLETKKWSSNFHELILALPPDRFMAYVAENYDCRPEAAYGSAATQNSAFRHYQEMREEIRNQQKLSRTRYQDKTDAAPRTAAAAKPAADSPYDLTPIKLMLGDTEQGLTFMPAEIIQQSNSEAVRRLLVGTEHFLRGKDNGCQWLNITDPRNITRTALVTTYYYDYLMHNDDMYFNENPDMRDEYIGGERQTGVFYTLNYRSFSDVYQTFADELDHRLEESGYTPFSIRNIYDLLLVLSAYVYLNPA